MTQIPTTTDPRGTRPRVVRVPSSQLGGPSLGNIPFGPVQPTSGFVGAAIAGAVGGFSAALLERNARMERAVRARQRTELSIENNTLIESALVEAAKVKPEHAEAAFRSRIQDQELKISKIEDKELQDQASLDFLGSSELGLIAVRRAAAEKLAGMQRAVVDAFGGQQVEKVRLGLDPESAIEAFESHLTENADGFSDEDIVNARQKFAAEVRDAAGHAVRARLTAFSVDLLERVDDVTSQDEIDDIIGDLQVAISAAVKVGAIETDQGVAFDQTFQRQIDARITKRIRSIQERATSFLNANDRSSIEALVEEAGLLPDNQGKADLLIRLDSFLKRLTVSGDDAQTILGIMFGGKKGDLPQNRLGLNNAYDRYMASGGDKAVFARRLMEIGSEFPSNLLRDVKTLTDQATKDLPQLARVLDAVGKLRGRALAAGSSEPDLALAVMGADQGELGFLSDPRVIEELERAKLHLRGDRLVNRKIEPMDVPAVIKSAFREKTAINTEQLEAFTARYFVRFAEFKTVLGDTSEDADVALKAAARAAEDIARDFEVLGGVLIRKTMLEDLDKDRLLDAAGSGPGILSRLSPFKSLFTASPFFIPGLFDGGNDPLVRLDLMFRPNDGKVYVPVVGETGPAAFIEVDPLDYKTRRIERGTDDFTILENQLRSDVAPVDFDPFSDLQWREDYGVTSIDEYDKQFGANFGGELYIRMRVSLTEDGLLDELDDQQQKDMVDKRALVKARQLGWENVFKPGGLGE